MRPEERAVARHAAPALASALAADGHAAVRARAGESLRRVGEACASQGRRTPRRSAPPAPTATARGLFVGSGIVC